MSVSLYKVNPIWTHLQQIWALQLGYGYLAAPTAIHRVEDACDDCVHVSGMELGGFFEEGQARMRVDHILHHWHQILGHNIRTKTLTTRQYVDKSWGSLMAIDIHSVQRRCLGLVAPIRGNLLATYCFQNSTKRWRSTRPVLVAWQKIITGMRQ